jgi:hypothetical protein
MLETVAAWSSWASAVEMTPAFVALFFKMEAYVLGLWKPLALEAPPSGLAVELGCLLELSGLGRGYETCEQLVAGGARTQDSDTLSNDSKIKSPLVQLDSTFFTT